MLAGCCDTVAYQYAKVTSCIPYMQPVQGYSYTLVYDATGLLTVVVIIC